jgi:hypothetical protein
LITQAPFNMNWLEFSLVTSNENIYNNSFTEVKVFPNPSQDIFNLRAEIKEMQNVQLDIFNLNGKIIQSKTLVETTAIQETISLNNFPNGLYFLVLRLEDGTAYSSKLVKVKK